MTGKFVTILLLGILAATYALPRPRRSATSVIVGGDAAAPFELPYQVSLQYYFSHFCGGAIISERHILTAAHCVNMVQPQHLNVVAGDLVLSANDGTEQRRRVKKLIAHEKFSSSTKGDDIALIEVDTPFLFNAAVGPIYMPPRAHRAAGNAMVSGWGSVSTKGWASDELLKVQVPLVSDEECERAYKRLNVTIVKESMLCAGYPEGGKDACQGDSGGPLVAYDRETKYLAGIVSWGYSCAEPGYPGVYTEVANFVEWINDKVAE